jgi:ABC-2 type transport system ATP-binding protein
MTPEVFLLFVAEAKGVNPELALRQVTEVMALTNITDMKDRLIANLSKGCRQRVGIAQAMLGTPEVIILDEPTVGLDPKQLVEVREMIRTLGEDRTVIVSSHILSEVSELCDELLVIAQGKLVAKGTLEDLEAMVGRTDTLHLSVRGDEAGILEVLRGIVDVEGATVTASQDTVSITLDIERGRDVRDDIFFAMADKRYAVVAMEIEHKSLENVFLALTQTEDEEEYDEEKYEDDDVGEEESK